MTAGNMLRRHRADETRYARTWHGEYRRYDLVKEFVIALAVMLGLTTILAAVFSSPDRPPVTLAEWARNAPDDFVATAAAELAGTSDTATYGAPYVDDPSAGQKLGPLPLQRWGGVREPVNPAQDFVLRPLANVASDGQLAAALDQYNTASPGQQLAWAQAYGAALDQAADDPAKVAAGDYGPVPHLTEALLRLAESGGLDGQLLAEVGFYQINYSKPLLFLADGGYLEDQARSEHLASDQWGMMNETGQYPGQAWLWLYTFWYQIPPFSTSGNADALVWALMAALSVLLILLPFIPGLRSIPRWIPVYKLVWRDYYRQERP